MKKIPFFQIALAVLLVFFFGHLIFQQNLVSGIDTVVQNFPFKHFLAQNFRNGNLPLWCRALGSGYPLYAEGQASYFYPLNLLLFVFSPATAFNLALVFSFFILSFSMFYFCRVSGFKKSASFLSSIVFAFGSFFILHLDNSNIIFAGCWMPLVMLLIELFFQKRRAIFILWAGLVLAFQFLAGFPQIAVYSLVLYIAYFVFRLVSSKNFARMAALAVVAAVLAGGIASVQLLPTMTLKKVSGYRYARVMKYDVSNLLTFVNPYVFGNPRKRNYRKNPVVFSLECHYIGLIPLILIFFAPFSRGRPRFFAILAAGMIAFLSAKPVFALYRHIPILGLFRFPHRLFIVVQFSLAFLAGAGFEKIKNSKIGLIALFFTAFDLFYFGFNYLSFEKKEKILKRPESALFLKKDSTHYRIYPYKYFGEQGILFRKNVLEGKKFPWGAFMEIMCPDSNLFWGVDSAEIYLSLYTRRYMRLRQFIEEKIKIGQGGAVVSPVAAKLLGAQNIKYILSPLPMKSPFLKLRRKIVKFGANFFIYEDKLFLPSAFLVPVAVNVGNISRMGDFLEKFKPSSQVILEEAPGKNYKPGRWKIFRADFSNDKAIFNLYSENGGYFVFVDSYYPGWKAFVDGVETHIFRANYRFKAVAIEKGFHKIEFNFSPGDLRSGYVVTSVSLALFALLVWIFWKKKI